MSRRMPADFFRSRNKLLGLGLAVIALAVVVAGVLGRRSHAAAIAERAAQSQVLTVKLVSAGTLAPAPLALPARIEAWSRAPIYARVSGYLKRWTVDIGAPVKAGQLLAELDTPDLDQQLLQARAELASARSGLALAASTARRWQELRAIDGVSQQETDEKTGDLAARQSSVAALQANVERMQTLRGYARLVAPFDGIVTARNTDVGALIGVGGAPGSELFVVSDVRRLRVYASVPQRQVAQVAPGAKAQLAVPERPGKTYGATVLSSAQAINPGSGTMLVQLSVDNAAGELLPGGFATVSFADAAAQRGVTVPPGALIFGKDGVQVATVTPQGRVRLQKVAIARDFGNVVELAGGREGLERIIDSPPDGVLDGDVVRVAQ